MANKLYEEQHIQNIANAIREKTGKTDSLLVSAMAEEIARISGTEDLTDLVALLGDGEVIEGAEGNIFDELAALIGGNA